LLQKNTIDELLTLLLEAKILVSGHPIYRTNAGILVEKRKVVFETGCSETGCSATQKRQKLVTEMRHKSYSAPEPQQ